MLCRPEVPAWPAEPMSAGPAAAPTQRGPAQWVLQRHFQNVEPPGGAVHRVDDAALVDEHVVDLDGARLRSSRRGQDVVRDLLGPERIGDIEHSHTAPRAGAAPGRLIVSIVP